MAQWTEQTYTVIYYSYEDETDPNWCIDMNVTFEDDLGWEWNAFIYHKDTYECIVDGYGCQKKTAQEAIEEANVWLRDQNRMFGR